MADLQAQIEDLWERRGELSADDADALAIVSEAIDLLDTGQARVAEIGANVHLSGGVGIGGVLEPPQASPVMIGDETLIGSRCMVVDGARVGTGSVLGAGVILSSSIPVIEAETGEELGRGVVPDWC